MKAVLVSLFTLFLSLEAFAEPYNLEAVDFQSNGVVLSGTLLSHNEIDAHAAIAFVHGSGPQTRSIELAKRFADHGITALV